MIKTVEWTKEGVRMLDQRLLPSEEKYLMLRSYEEVAEAIKKMVVRGAPAIGVSAAMGIALGAKSISRNFGRRSRRRSQLHVRRDGQDASYRSKSFLGDRANATTFERAKPLGDVEEVKKVLIAEALKIFEKTSRQIERLDVMVNHLIPDGATVLTHCNAGALATAGDYGTALGVIRGARRRRKESRRDRRRDPAVSSRACD